MRSAGEPIFICADLLIQISSSSGEIFSSSFAKTSMPALQRRSLNDRGARSKVPIYMHVVIVIVIVIRWELVGKELAANVCL